MKLILATLLALTCCITVYAQVEVASAANARKLRRHEVMAGHGHYPSGQLFMPTGYPRPDYYTFQQGTGAYFISYRHVHSIKISYGFTAVYEHEEGLWHGSHPRMSSITFGGQYRQSSYTFAPELTIKYATFAKGLIRLYGTIGAGFTIRDEHINYGNDSTLQRSDFSKTIPFRLYGSPIGISAGHTLTAFCELGVGYKGLVNYGVGYKF